MKRLLVIIDGMEDEPIAQLGNMTPAEYAYMPALTFMRRHGDVSRVRTIPVGVEASTEVALLSILGVKTSTSFQCRSSFEALGGGINIGKSDLCLRCNLIAHSDGKITSHCGFNPDYDTSYEIVNILNLNYGDEDFKFHCFGNFRNILVIRNCDSSIQARPPHTLLGESVHLLHVNSDNSDLENRLNHCIIDSRNALRGYTANGVSLWSPSHAATFSNTVSGAVVTGVNIVKGIGRALGMSVVDVPGATGDEHTDYAAKLNAALDALRHYDFVLLHIEAPDEVSHQLNWKKKIKILEKIDSLILAPLLYRSLPLSVTVQADHATSSLSGHHLSNPVTVINYTLK